MSIADMFMLALTAWRENRGGGPEGMQSVINVICNRAKRNVTSPYTECVRKWQFSSLTAAGDPELILWPQEKDTEFLEAQALAYQASMDWLADLTNGATSYYALSMKEPPKWASKMTKTAEIKGQVFFV